MKENWFIELAYISHAFFLKKDIKYLIYRLLFKFTTKGNIVMFVVYSLYKDSKTTLPIFTKVSQLENLPCDRWIAHLGRISSQNKKNTTMPMFPCTYKSRYYTYTVCLFIFSKSAYTAASTWYLLYLVHAWLSYATE